MNLKDLITKTETQRNTVLELIQKAETKEDVNKELAVERFIKGFLFDLRSIEIK